MVYDLVLDQSRFLHHFVRTRRLSIIYVQHVVTVQREVIRYEHTMAAEVNPLGAHDRGRRLVSETHDSLGSFLKLSG